MFRIVPELTFGFAFNQARATSDLICDSTSTFDGPSEALYFLAEDWRAGFSIRPDGELVYVFSLDRGHGDDIMRAALANGARRLDCFDGYLVEFYARHGFEVTAREPNWTPGGPDVVFMALPAGHEIGQSR